MKEKQITTLNGFNCLLNLIALFKARQNRFLNVIALNKALPNFNHQNQTNYFCISFIQMLIKRKNLAPKLKFTINKGNIATS